MKLPHVHADDVSGAAYIADFAHDGQTDPSGVAAIEHPARVARRMRRPAMQVVAWLQGVLEGTVLTVDDLRVSGVHPELVDAVVALTRTPGEDTGAYYDRVCANPIAVAVKLADVAVKADRHLAGSEGAADTQMASAYAHTTRVLADAAHAHGLKRRDLPAARGRRRR
jgi:(p)ppGpp synthase/HD superfamily hydrolase